MYPSIIFIPINLKVYNINDICDYIILSAKADEDTPLSNLKLQKVLYYIQAWHLAFYEEPFFDGKFQAWVHGPVNREIYDRFKSSKYLFSEIRSKDVLNKLCINTISSDDKDHINNVLEVYLPYSGVQLESMTHNESPWLKARKGISRLEYCENEISEDDMKAFYKSKIDDQKQ